MPGSSETVALQVTVHVTVCEVSGVVEPDAETAIVADCVAAPTYFVFRCDMVVDRPGTRILNETLTLVWVGAVGAATGRGGAIEPPFPPLHAARTPANNVAPRIRMPIFMI